MNKFVYALFLLIIIIGASTLSATVLFAADSDTEVISREVAIFGSFPASTHSSDNPIASEKVTIAPINNYWTVTWPGGSFFENRIT